MLKHSFKALIPLFILLSAVTTHAITDAKAVVVDVQYLMENSSAYHSARKQIDEISTALHNKMAETEQSLKREKDALINKRGVVDSKKLEQEIEQFNKKISKIQMDIQKKKSELEQLHGEAVNKIQSYVNQIITTLANEKNFNIAIPSSQLLYAKPQLDITEDVLERLNETIPSVEITFDLDDTQEQ